MTKQEEIREGIKERIRAYASELHPSNVECNEMAKLLLMFLHLQGVVIKVDRELPVCACCEGTGLIGGAGINDCCPECNGTGKIYCVGYVAVEPLIKEQANDR